MSEASVTLRPVREDELPLLVTILAELDDTAPWPQERVLACWQAMHAYPNYEVYFAQQGEQIVGSLSLLIFPVLAHDLAREAIVEAVVIRPAFRGKGLGRAMFQAAIALAASQGAYKLALSSNLRRLDAHRFYESIGFARHGYSFSTDLSTQK